MRNRVTRSFGTTPFDDIRQRVYAEPYARYRMELSPADLATVCVALREYSGTCANASGECVNERAQMLYLSILETLEVEEV
jgi:hypothetical protein